MILFKTNISLKLDIGISSCYTSWMKYQYLEWIEGRGGEREREEKVSEGRSVADKAEQ